MGATPLYLFFHQGGPKKSQTNPFSARADERQRDGNDVDSELELQKLGDTVVHVATPNDRFHDARKVVVKQYDVRRFLSNVRAADALHRSRQWVSGSWVMGQMGRQNNVNGSHGSRVSTVKHLTHRV